MALGPGNVLPSDDEPRSRFSSVAGRHQPPPLTRLLPLALRNSRPLRYTLGRPADSARCSVLDSPSVKWLKCSFWVLEMAPLSTRPDSTATSPSVTSCGSTP